MDKTPISFLFFFWVLFPYTLLCSFEDLNIPYVTVPAFLFLPYIVLCVALLQLFVRQYTRLEQRKNTFSGGFLLGFFFKPAWFSDLTQCAQMKGEAGGSFMLGK